MGVFDNVGNALSGLLGGAFGSTNGEVGTQGQGFHQVLTAPDFFTSTDTDIATNNTDYTRIGRFTVGAQRLYHWGHGAPNTENQGRIYFRIDHVSGTQMHGTVRFVQSNAQGTLKITVFESSTRNLSGSQTDKTQQIPLPEQVQYPLVGEDSVLLVEFKSEHSTSTMDMDSANNIWLLPVTVYQ
jgi:hypothetical protein